MSRTLVTIICHRDRWGVELLCRTMDKYLNPCNVIFVLNEDDEKANILNQWFQEMCMPHLKKFSVKIYRKYQFWKKEHENHLSEFEYEGWVDQQVLKLAISEKVVTEHYLLLDAKNFFVRPTDILEIGHKHPEPSTWCEPILQNWIVTCLETFSLSIPSKPIRLTANITPYVIRRDSAKDLVKYFGGNGFLFKWFSMESRKEKHSPSEFFLYEIWTMFRGYRNLGDTKQNCISIWEHMVLEEGMTQQDFVKYFIHMFNTYNVKLAGIHKMMYVHWSHKEAMFILKRLGVYDCIPKTNSPFSAK